MVIISWKINATTFRKLMKIFPHPLLRKNGMPNTPVNVMFGADIIKKIQGYTNDDIVGFFQNFRKKCYQYELESGNDLMHACKADSVIRLKKEFMERILESLLHYTADNDFNQFFIMLRMQIML